MSIKDQDQLNDDGKFRKSLYKSLLYSYSAAALKSGVISLKPSYRYLSLENYLYPYAGNPDTYDLPRFFSFHYQWLVPQYRAEPDPPTHDSCA